MREIYNRDTAHIGRVSKRKRKDRWLGLLTMCLLFIVGTSGFAQTIQIGSGTSTNSNVPINYNWGYNYSQTIYTSAQMVAAGANSSGTITKLRFKPTAAVSTSLWKDWVVYIGNTTKTSFDTTTDWVPLSGLTQVFSGSIVANTVANQWIEISFTAPFQWTGGNIVIAVDENTAGYANNPLWASFTSGTDASIYYRNDSTNPNPSSPPSASGRTGTIAQIQFDGDLQPGCSGIPAGGTASLSSTTGNSGSTFTATATGVTAAAGLSLQWQKQVGQNWEDILNATSLSSIITAEVGAVGTATKYRLKVTCANSNEVAYSTEVTHTLVLVYCTPASTASGTFINNFSTTLGSTNISNTSGYTTGGYQNNYGGTAVTSYATGSFNYNFTITGGSLGAAIWIDWNSNGTFETGEKVFVTSSYGSGPYAGTITIPGGTALGDYRMRVMVDYNNSAPSDPCVTSSTSTRTETEDYKITVGAAPACLAPTALVSSNIAPTTATLSWTASTSSPSNGYDIYYSTTNTAPLAETTPTVNNHTLSSITLGELSSATTYYWWVRSDCGSETSVWASGGSFTTLCDLVTTFSQNWDGVTATALPICFNKVGTLGTVNTQASSASSGTNTLYIYGVSTSSEPTLALQPVSNAGAGTHWLKFKLRANFTVGGKLQVGYLTNPTDATSFVMIQEFIANSATTYEEFKCIPGTLPGSNTTLALRAKGSPANSMLVDDLVWELAPSCLPPSEPTATINSLNSATLSWTSEGTSFDIEWGTAGFAQSSGTVVNGVSNNHQLNGLTAETSYSFYVRQDCGSAQSTWAGPYTFYTGYCVPTGTSSSYRITGVATTGGYANITNTTNGTTLPYNNYSAMNVSQSPGGSISYTVNTPSSSGIKIWVDMNQNLVFDANELVASHLVYSGTGTWTGTLAVPEDLPLGNYRMRIRSGYYAYPDQIYACGSNYSNYGEAEDYTLSVVAPPSCLPVTNLSVVHTLTSANLSWTASTSAPSEGYEWEVRTSGAAGSGNEGLVSSGTTAAEVVTATASGLVLNTNHTLYVRANCGGGDFSVWAASAPFYVGYCVPVTSSGCTDGDVIARVVLNTLDNNSGTGCPSGTLGYSNYTTNPALTTTLQAGNSYSCTVYAGEFSEGYAAWIDYNNDGVFDNATERIGYSNGKVTGSGEEGVLGSSASFPVVISCNPTPGNYRLRVRAMFNTNGIDVTPCTANTYGETEDYMITISAAVACPQPNTLAVTAINAQGATLNWNAGCEETLWDVHVGLAGSGSPAGSPSDASVTQAFVKTGLNHSTQYEYWVRANCGSGSVSDWSGPFAFTTTCPSGIWTGTTNTDWNTASNWTDGVVPAACTAVSITAANAVVIPSEVTVASLSIGATANVTVNGILNVGNIAVANGGIFTVANNAVVLQTPTAVNTGVTTVKVNSANLYRQDYTLWSSPVAGQNLRSFSPQTLFNRFSSYDTALGTVGDYVQEIVTTADMNTKTFVNAKGYMIRMPNNWTQFVNASIPGTPYLGQFTGTLNNGNVSIALSQANTKLNLVGNPYPSPISISAFFAANPDINEVLYFWRKRNDAAGSGYATYNSMGLVSLQSDVNGLDMNNTIKPGQGFFVQSNTATTLNFTNAMRTSSQGTFLRGASTTNELHRFWLNLSNTTGVVGQTLIGYATGATLGVDNGLDALYFNDSPLALTSLIDNNEYAIQGRSLPFVDTDVVPLGFKTDVAGSFTISLSNFDGLFADDQAIYLRDNTTGVVHNLKLSEYNFTTGSGIFNTRFEVLYSTTLGTNNPALTHNNILVGVKDQIIQINAGNVTMEKIELIDVSGRVIYTQDGVNATTATLENVVMNNQMLIVRIHTKESGIVTQKIIF